MGKTVELLGLVCAAPATVEQLKAPGLAKNHNEEGPLVASRATLIVVPPALVSQWVNDCVEINQCVGCSSGEGPASPRHRAGIASMAWRTTR